MSTNNFVTQNDFDLWVIDTDNFQNDDYEVLNMDFKYCILFKIKDLTYCELCLKDGYYSGIQSYIKIEHDPMELDNESCHYYFDKCKSKAIKEFKSEINYINKKVLPKLKEISFIKIRKVGGFSNGEAIYEVA